MIVDILCRVVDNLGDIGFAYRLARSLSELGDPPRLRVVVDDLASFAALCPGIDPALPYQTVNGWEIFRWNDPGEAAVRLYRAAPPRVAIECYACGRPEWFEGILFDPSDGERRLLIDLEYFTVEQWSAEYHLLPSLTRSPYVQKAIFMPGILPGTGGLLQDAQFAQALAEASGQASRESMRAALLGEISSVRPIADSWVSAYWVLVFSYEHDFESLVGDLAEFGRDRPVLAFAAAGRSAIPFLRAWERAGAPFPVIPLPMLGQLLWDRLFAATDFAVIRGEESFSRAILAGRPFLWECYPFTESDGVTAGHLEKIRAFLEALRQFSDPGEFAVYEKLTRRFNRACDDTPDSPVECQPQGDAVLPGDLLRVLRAAEIGNAFRKLSQMARDRGNLAVNLMTFIDVSLYNAQ